MMIDWFLWFACELRPFSTSGSSPIALGALFYSFSLVPSTSEALRLRMVSLVYFGPLLYEVSLVRLSLVLEVWSDAAWSVRLPVRPSFSQKFRRFPQLFLPFARDFDPSFAFVLLVVLSVVLRGWT